MTLATQSSSCALRSSGSRYLDLDMLAAQRRAESFKGQPDIKPLVLLAAFQEAAPAMGLSVQARQMVPLFFETTRRCDWEEGARPLAWPSMRRQQEYSGLSVTRVKAVNRELLTAGVLIARDSPNGRRHGRRDRDGKIVLAESFGFDLSPFLYRHQEYREIAQRAATERLAMRQLRSRATVARRAVWQVGEAMQAAGSVPEDWPRLAGETKALTAAAGRARRSDELRLVVEALEVRRAEAEGMVQPVEKAASPPSNSDPLGSENGPLNTNTSTDLNLFEYVETAPDRRSPREVPTVPPPKTTSSRVEPQIAADELVDLAPRLGQWVKPAGRRVAWSDIHKVIGALCTELEVPARAYREACATMGQDRAAIALAIMSTKPEGHFTRNAAAYFTGMVQRAERGELNLERTLWKLRRDTWAGRGQCH
jgi:replication initiation protein RepC